MAIQTQVTQNLVPVMTVFNSDGSCAGLVGPGGNFLSVPIGAQTPNTGAFTTLTTTGGVTIDASGNIGLAVTPSAWAAAYKAIQVTNGASLWSTNSGAVYLSSNVYFDGGARRFIYSGTALEYNQSGGQHVWYNGATGGTAGNAISFIQAMTLDAVGRLLLNQTTAGLANSNSFSIEPASGYAVWNHASSQTSGSFYHYFGYNGGTIGSITQSGTTAVLYNTTSDQRLKENIADADSASSLIDAVQVRQFDWIADGTHQRYGFVAQELVEVVPEAVHTPVDEAEMMAVDYSKLVPLLVKEIQELRARVATLEGKKR